MAATISAVLQTIAQSAFTLAFQKSPIILCNGIATNIPGNMLPIIAITEAVNFNLSILSGSNPLNLNAFFANFWPLPGATLIDNDLGEYPFANQTVAANAIINKPLTLSMMMDIPAKLPGGYVSKLVTVTALKAALDLHINQGGTFTVATPAFTYTNGVLKTLRDQSRSDTKQAQNRYQWDFEFPLLTQAQATTALGAILSKVAGGLPTSSTAWSSVLNSIGIPSSGAASTLNPTSILGTSSSNSTATTFAQPTAPVLAGAGTFQ
jgi:hypothetical protein